MTLKKITTNLYVEDVEPCARFWMDRLGFEKIVEVPDGDKLAFAMLKKGPIELMYGSYASLDKDAEAGPAYTRGTTFLYIDVDNLDEVAEAMQGAVIVKAPNETFYGTREFTAKDPAGHFVTFAQDMK